MSLSKTKNRVFYLGRMVGDPVKLEGLPGFQMAFLVDTAKGRLSEGDPPNIHRCIVGGGGAEYLRDKSVGEGSTVFVEGRSRSKALPGSAENDPMAPRETVVSVNDLIVHTICPRAKAPGVK